MWMKIKLTVLAWKWVQSLYWVGDKVPQYTDEWFRLWRLRYQRRTYKKDPRRTFRWIWWEARDGTDLIKKVVSVIPDNQMSNCRRFSVELERFGYVQGEWYRRPKKEKGK